jgi:hypothetical protein
MDRWNSTSPPDTGEPLFVSRENDGNEMCRRKSRHDISVGRFVSDTLGHPRDAGNDPEHIAPSDRNAKPADYPKSIV